MGIELWGSFLVYIFCFFQRRVSTTLCGVVVLICILGAASFDPRLAFGLTCFMVGTILHQSGIRIKSTIFAVAVLCFGLYLAGVHNHSASYPFVGQLFGHHAYLLVNIASAPLIVLGVLSLRSVQDVLEHQALVELGRRSFSIYLIHLPILYSVTAVVNYAAGYDQYFNVLALLTSAFVTFASVYLAGKMSLIDIMAMKVSKRLHP